jgi:hypothetical protein
MNDFTKDELYTLLIEMNISINKAPPLKPAKSFIELRDKIQSLIDNYCDEKIEWIQGALMSDNGFSVGHSFRFNGNCLSIKSLPIGNFPPYACVNLSIDDAHRIRNWLNDILHVDNYPESCSEAIRKYHEL